MENDFSHGGDQPEHPEAASARETLRQLQDDGSRLAARVVTPWWYHPALGAIVAAFVGSQVLPGSTAIWIVAVGIMLLPVLTITYNRRYGVSTTQPAGSRGKRLLLTLLAILILAMVSSLAIKFLAFSPWWGLIPAVSALLATVVLGRRYDDALRDELGGRTGRA
ncbi:hypothetical protein [Acidipropionibacterium jensenii]|uniref:hypothetical protein n=1 Tax=Acidipropionibacterium jensenii TaxID=1749 RepID=UPI000F842CE3|nr:hypothetical protein [Acidipropionibacterium jensenii]